MSFYDLPETLEQDINLYAELVEGYEKGSVDKARFKAFRVPMGVYEQREAETYMCRLRLPGGAITPGQLIAVAKAAEKYSDRPLHFTTRQEVQIHRLKLKDTVKIMRELKEAGLSSRGGGGNTVRNIIGDGSPEVEPYLQALTTRLIAEKDSWSLPRKLKIAFSGGPEDKGLATVNDLGFIAKLDPKTGKGFSVYIAGGMGNKPQPGFLLYAFIPDVEVYNIARATKVLFDKYGNRKNKNAARMRFLLNQLGREEFVSRFEKELNQVRNEKHPALKIVAHKTSPVKQGFLEIPLFLGDLSASKAKLLGRIMRDFGDDVIRATNRQNLFLCNLSSEEVAKLEKELKKNKIIEEFPPAMGGAVACTGASTCRLGICLSRGLLQAVREQFESDGLKTARLDDLLIKISGCPNSCGHHPIADIGFFGVAKRFRNQLVPCYTLVVGAVIEEGKTKLAQKVGVIPAKAIPAFLSDFFKFIQKSRKENEKFVDYLDRAGLKEASRLCEQYSSVPEFEQDQNFYFDWSSEELFSLAGKTEGECSAGIYDLIDWDFANLDKIFIELEKNPKDQNLLQAAVVSAARALLITKGLEPKDENEAVRFFKDYFIGKHVNFSFSDLITRYLERQLLKYEEIKALSEAVKELYNSMDNSLRFPELAADRVVGKQEKIKQQFRDFRGVACPLNFVKTKLVLETMQPGERLEILLDDGAPIDNVPASVKAEGNKIIKQEKTGEYWSVLIEKKG